MVIINGNIELVNCKNAQPVLIQGNYNSGITYKEAHQIALDVFRTNSMQLSKDASDTAINRAEELINEFLNILFTKDQNLIAKLKEPSVQLAFVTAQREYAKTGNKITKEMLIEALNERIISPEQTLKQRILDEVISAMSKITIDQMNFLSLWFVILNKRDFVSNKQEFKQFIENKIMKFYTEDFNSKQFFSYLYYTNCVKILPEGGTFKPIEELLSYYYSGIFSTGFTEEEFKAMVDNDINKYLKLFVKCLNDDTKLQFDALNDNILTIKLKNFGFSNKEKEILKLSKEKQKNINDIKKELIEICPTIQEVLELWKNNSEVKALELTPIGLVIAILNYNRVTGDNVDVNLYI